MSAGAIGVPHEIKGNELIVFCVLAPNLAPDPGLRTALIERVTMAMGKPMKPRDILFVSDLPKTRNSKVMRRVLRSAYLDEPQGDTSSLINPQVIPEIRKAGQERT